MDFRNAADLIRGAVPRSRATWCDLGAGSGTFTKALASLLAPESRVFAVDRDAASVRKLKALSRTNTEGVEIIAVEGDFTTPLELSPMDGVLLANSLHYVPYQRQSDVLKQILSRVLPEGRLVIVDYDGRGPNRWVPYPVSKARFTELSEGLRLGDPIVVGERPSAYGGTIYAAFTR